MTERMATLYHFGVDAFTGNGTWFHNGGCVLHGGDGHGSAGYSIDTLLRKHRRGRLAF